MTKALIAWLLEPVYRRLWRYAVRSGIVLACSDAPDTSGINAAAVQPQWATRA